jgi:hypothetical protein
LLPALNHIFAHLGIETMVQTAKLEEIKGFQEEKTKGVSPWMLSLEQELGPERPAASWSYTLQDFEFKVIEGDQSLWVIIHFPQGGEIALRAAYCPYNHIAITDIRHTNDGLENVFDQVLEVELSSVTGEYHVRLDFPRADRALIRCTTTLIPAAPLFLPYFPRDIIPLGPVEDLIHPEGVIYTKQVGPRTGMVYFSLSKPKAGSVMYFQNLTALNDYAEQTKTSLQEVVGGNWPELGLSLPAATEQPLEAGKEIVISDAFILFNPSTPQDDLEMSRQFLDSLAQIYLALPRVETEYRDWTEIVKKSVRDLSNSEKCWTTIRNVKYLNAYVGDHDTPPESMVQLSVLLPMLEYADWAGEEIPISKGVLATLPKFFDSTANVYGRWLVSEENKLDGSEDHKKPRVMDSWYMYHSLLNLSRLAIRGDASAKKMFLDSLDYVVEVARKFKYQFPIFYNLDTMEVIKAEAEEGRGGENDVAGQYAHVMMQAWELTKDKRYLEEAMKAAKVIQGLGFKLLYQANSTIFSSGALLRLWKETGDELYLHLSYLALANIFNNMWLWECNYGYAKNYSTFFALFPLRDAPYTAVYEEIEAVAALHDYLSYLDGDSPEWMRILIPEFIRVLMFKGGFYYPALLPEEMISQEPGTGEIDRKLWIPLEDIHDGWEQAGQVGQEIYGAGLPFGLVPRHYHRVEEKDFIIYLDYPTVNYKSEEKGQLSFDVFGDPRLSCRMRIMPIGKKSLPDLEVEAELQNQKMILKSVVTDEGHLEYEVPGGHKVHVKWSNGKSNRNGKE